MKDYFVTPSSSITLDSRKSPTKNKLIFKKSYANGINLIVFTSHIPRKKPDEKYLIADSCITVC